MSVAIDAITSVTDLAVNNPITFDHTCSGHDRYLIVGVMTRNTTVTGITYGGVAMTALGSASSTFSKMYLYGLVNPLARTNQVSVTQDAAGKTVVGVISFNGVAQTSSVGTFAGTTGNNATPTINVTSAVGERVVDTMAFRQATSPYTLTVGAGQVQQWNRVTGSSSGDVTGAGSTEPGAASVTMSWSSSGSDRWSIGGISLRPAAARNCVLLGTEIL